MTFARFLLVGALATFAFPAYAASCLIPSQLPQEQRDALVNQVHSFVSITQNGDLQSLRARTLPAIASDFGAISATVTTLMPQVRNATITIDALYSLDASKEQPGEPRVQFFCGNSPLVVLTFNGIPPDNYALAILHATGVPNPQQISIILAATSTNQWQLAGLYSNPMIEADHDGLWYWTSARKYAQDHANLSAWLYYKIAEDLLIPVDFLSSPNTEKLRQEADQSRPPALSANTTMLLNVNGVRFNVTRIGSTTQFGPLDLELHYVPDSNQTAQLGSPMTARKQIDDLMAALVTQHPELREAFHGIWALADQGQSSLFALEVPMDQIATGSPAQPAPTH
jgi:hypothetical protein